MNPSRLLDAVRARPAVLAAAALVLICLLGFVGFFRPPPARPPTLLLTNSPPGPVTSVQRDLVPVVPVAPKPPPPPPQPQPPTPPPTPAPAPAPPPVPLVKTNPPLGLLAIHVELPAETNPPALGIYAPAGRLLRCQLFNTVDSSSADTPIIALVTDDLWHDNQLVVPAGTEVHSRARIDRLRERIIATGTWTLVWQSGEELAVTGIALDRGASSDGQTWDITDGSLGLKGAVIHGDSMDEFKLFGGTFLSGLASGLQQTRTTPYGTEVLGNARNGLLAGASQVLNSYAQQILEAIKRDGIYVRVPAGKQMYLYITQTIDRSQARIGNLRVTSHPVSVSFPNLNPNNNKP